MLELRSFLPYLHKYFLHFPISRLRRRRLFYKSKMSVYLFCSPLTWHKNEFYGHLVNIQCDFRHDNIEECIRFMEGTCVLPRSKIGFFFAFPTSSLSLSETSWQIQTSTGNFGNPDECFQYCQTVSILVLGMYSVKYVSLFDSSAIPSACLIKHCFKTNVDPT